MRLRTVILLSFSILAGPAAAHADDGPLDCSRRSLADVVNDNRGRGRDDDPDKDRTIRFTGVCAGPIVIRTDGINLKGVGTAIIDGGGQNDAITVDGASRVSLADFEVRNGVNGVLGINGAHLTIDGVNAHDNFVFGISLRTSSSALISDVTASHNGVHRIDLETGAAAEVSGSLTWCRSAARSTRPAILSTVCR